MARFVPQDILSSYGSVAALNANFDDIAALMERVVFRDGTSPNTLSADFDANHFRLKNVGAPVSNTDALRLQDIVNVTSESALATALATAAGAGLIGYGGFTLLEKLDETVWKSPEEFGAVGDGVTDDQPAFDLLNAWIDSNNGGYIRLGKNKTYRYGSNVTGTGGAWRDGAPAIAAIGTALNRIPYLYVDLNGSTLKMNDDIKYGTFNTTTGLPVVTVVPYSGAGRAEAPNAIETLYVDEVQIFNGYIDGNAAEAVIGGFWGDDGWQIPGSGVRITEYARVFMHNVHTSDNLSDGFASETTLTSTSPSAPFLMMNCTARRAGRNSCTNTGSNAFTAINCTFADGGGVINTVAGLVQTSPKSCCDVEEEAGVNKNVTFINCQFLSGLYSNTAYVEDSGDTFGTTFYSCHFEGAFWSNQERMRMYAGSIRGKIAKCKADAKFLGTYITDQVLGSYPLGIGVFITNTEGSPPVGQQKPTFRDCLFDLTKNVVNLRNAKLRDCTINFSGNTSAGGGSLVNGTTIINLLASDVEGLKVVDLVTASQPADGYKIVLPERSKNSEIVTTTGKIKWFDHRYTQGGFTGTYNIEKPGVVPVEIFASANGFTDITREKAGLYRVVKTGGGSAWNGDAFSRRGFEGEFVVEFRAISGTADSAVGIDTTPEAAVDFASIAYNVAIAAGVGGAATVYYGPTSQAVTFTLSSSLYFVRDAAGVITIRNGTSLLAATTVHTIGVVAGTFYPDMSLYLVNSTVDVKAGLPEHFA